MLPLIGLVTSPFRVERTTLRRGVMESHNSTDTVDQNASTVGSTDEVDTVPQDDPTQARPHLLTLFYPADTPAKFTAKFPKRRVSKRAGEVISMGRLKEGSDVRLNDEHMSLSFAEIHCRLDADSGQPRWFVKNVSDKKPVRLSLGENKTVLKTNREQELSEGCTLKLETLHFLVAIEEGDLGEDTKFELELRPLDNSAHPIPSRQISSSTDSTNSLTSAAGLGRATPSSQPMSGSQPLGPLVGIPMSGPVPGTRGVVPSTAVMPAPYPPEYYRRTDYFQYPYPCQYPPGYGQGGYSAPGPVPGSAAAPGFPPYGAPVQQAAGMGPGLPGPGPGAGFPSYIGATPGPVTASPGGSQTPGYPAYSGQQHPLPGADSGRVPDFQQYNGHPLQAAGITPAGGMPGQFLPHGSGHHPGGGTGPPFSGQAQYVPGPQQCGVVSSPHSFQPQPAGVTNSQQARFATQPTTNGPPLGYSDLQQYPQENHVPGSLSQVHFPTLGSQGGEQHWASLQQPRLQGSDQQDPRQGQRHFMQPGFQAIGQPVQQNQQPEGRLYGPMSLPQQPVGQQPVAQQPVPQQPAQGQDKPAAVVAQPESAAIHAREATAFPFGQGGQPVVTTPMPQYSNTQLYCYTERGLPTAPPVTQLSSLKLASPIQVTSQLGAQPVEATPANSLSGSRPGGWTIMVDSAGQAVQDSAAGAVLAPTGMTPSLGGPSSQQSNVGVPDPTDAPLLDPAVARPQRNPNFPPSQQTSSAPPNLPHSGGAALEFPAVVAPAFFSLTQAAGNGNRVNLRSHDQIAPVPPPSADFPSAGSYRVEDLQASGSRHNPASSHQGGQQQRSRGQENGGASLPVSGSESPRENELNPPAAGLQGSNGAVTAWPGSWREPQEDDERLPQEHDDRH